MRQGKKTPPAVRQWIVRAKALFPEYTSKAIAELVESKFDEIDSIDKTTVQRIINASRTADTLDNTPEGIADRYRQLAERYAGLGEDYAKLADALSVPQPHQLGSASLHSDDTRLQLATTWTGSAKRIPRGWSWEPTPGSSEQLRLTVERDPLFPSLQEALPAASLWKGVEVWKEETGSLLWRCRQLVEEIVEASEQAVGATVRRPGNHPYPTLYWEYVNQIYIAQFPQTARPPGQPSKEYAYSRKGWRWRLLFGNRRIATHRDNDVLKSWAAIHHEMRTSHRWNQSVDEITEMHDMASRRAVELRCELIDAVSAAPTNRSDSDSR